MTHYRVEYQNYHGDWIRKSFHKSLKAAKETALACVKGYPVRIVHDGKIVWEG
jgi:hypothetical protein